jgi:EF-hand domain
VFKYRRPVANESTYSGFAIGVSWASVQVDPVVRMFDILRKDNCNHISQDDLKSMLAGILLSHAGLEFLQETPEFQDR